MVRRKKGGDNLFWVITNEEPYLYVFLLDEKLAVFGEQPASFFSEC